MEENIRKVIGKNVRQRRNYLGLSLQFVSGGLDISYQQLQKYEKGENSIGAEKLPKLTEILQCSLDSLYLGIHAGNIENQPEILPKYSRRALEAARLFNEIDDPKTQKLVLNVISLAVVPSKNA